jgi:predicted Zn-dependent protease
MTTTPAETAQMAARGLSTDPPWELFGQRLRRYEVYFDGPQIETMRGPILVEGVGLRVFRPKGTKTAVGFQATTDLSRSGIAAMTEAAERLTRYAAFPASRIVLPTGSGPKAGEPKVLDPSLWSDPVKRVQEYVEALLAAFPSSQDPAPSFGSLKATLIENSITNSAGLSATYAETLAELETAVKAGGGPEGPPPGEYWVTREMRRLDTAPLRAEVALWCDRARDVRRAKQPPSGRLPIGLPTSLLAEILPFALGTRFSGGGRLRKVAVEPGTRLASESVSLHHDPTIPWSVGSTPIDDEGTIPTVVPLIERGIVGGLFYDCLHAGAFDIASNGAAVRQSDFGRKEWLRFSDRPSPAIATVSVAPGSDGSDAEIIENVEEGVWVDQLGWPHPDSVSSSFGGEIRIAYRIHRGRLTEPLRGGTVGGLTFAPPETPSLLGSVRALGSTPTLVGGVFSPSMVVDGLTLSGEG